MTMKAGENMESTLFSNSRYQGPRRVSEDTRQAMTRVREEDVEVDPEWTGSCRKGPPSFGVGLSTWARRDTISTTPSSPDCGID